MFVLKLLVYKRYYRLIYNVNYLSFQKLFFQILNDVINQLLTLKLLMQSKDKKNSKKKYE